MAYYKNYTSKEKKKKKKKKKQILKRKGEATLYITKRCSLNYVNNYHRHLSKLDGFNKRQNRYNFFLICSEQSSRKSDR